jgi:hypothetical protein
MELVTMGTAPHEEEASGDREQSEDDPVNHGILSKEVYATFAATFGFFVRYHVRGHETTLLSRETTLTTPRVEGFASEPEEANEREDLTGVSWAFDSKEWLGHGLLLG